MQILQVFYRYFVGIINTFYDKTPIKAPKATNKIGFEQGKNNEQAKRQDGNRQELEYTKICALDSCKEPFLHNIHNQKYCSTDCRKLAYEKRKAIGSNI